MAEDENSLPNPIPVNITTPTAASLATRIPNSAPNDLENEHRRLFMDTCFSLTPQCNTPKSRLKKNPAILSTSAYNQQLRILRYWNMPAGHVDTTTGRHVTQYEFRRSNSRSWYNNVKFTRISRDETNTEVLERLDEKSQTWKRVVHTDNVFDAIKDCHGQIEHRNIGLTKDEVDKKFWNISENLCRSFVHTCPKCKNSSSKTKTPRPVLQSTIGNVLIDRYILSVIDYQKNPQKDLLGNTMSYMLLAYDQLANWIVLTALPTLNIDIVENEILNVVCTRGYQRSLENDVVFDAVKSLAHQTIREFEALGTNNYDDHRTVTVKEVVMLVQHSIEMIENIETNNGSPHPNWVLNIPFVMMKINNCNKINRKKRRESTSEHSMSIPDPIRHTTTPTRTSVVQTVTNSANVETEDQNTTSICPITGCDPPLSTQIASETKETPEGVIDDDPQKAIVDAQGESMSPVPQSYSIYLSKLTINEIVQLVPSWPPERFVVPRRKYSIPTTTTIDQSNQGHTSTTSHPTELAVVAQGMSSAAQNQKSPTPTNSPNRKHQFDHSIPSQVTIAANLESDSIQPSLEMLSQISTLTVNKELSSPVEQNANPGTDSVPQTQGTLTQISVLMDDKELSAPVKQMYTTKNWTIEQFFKLKPSGELTAQPTNSSKSEDTTTRVAANGTNEEDDVLIVTPPPKSKLSDDVNGIRIPKIKEYSVEEAFRSNKTTTTSVDDVEYRLCHPRLICDICNEYSHPPVVTIAENHYYEVLKEDNRRFTVDIVTAFGILCSHEAHREDTIYVDATLPNQPNVQSKSEKEELPSSVKTVISVAFNSEHFAIMRLCLEERHGYFYDGLSWSVGTWKAHMKHVLNRFGIQGQSWKMIPGTGRHGLNGITVKQKDESNCGPIACIVLWKLFRPESCDVESRPISEYRAVVIEEMMRLIMKHKNTCVLFKRDRRRISDESSKVDDMETLGLAAPLPSKDPNSKTAGQDQTDQDIQPPSPKSPQKKSKEKRRMSPRNSPKRKSPKTKEKKASNTQVDTKSTSKTRQPNVGTKKKREEDNTADSTYGLFEMEQSENEKSLDGQTNDAPKAPTSFPKKRRIAESPCSESETPSSQLASAVSNDPQTITGTSVQLEKKSTMISSGFSDSEEEEYMEKITAERMKNQAVPSHIDTNLEKEPSLSVPFTKSKKPRIQITKTKMTTTMKPSTKKINHCQCKGKCDKACGCRKQGRICTARCTCMAVCNNNKL